MKFAQSCELHVQCFQSHKAGVCRAAETEDGLPCTRLKPIKDVEELMPLSNALASNAAGPTSSPGQSVLSTDRSAGSGAPASQNGAPYGPTDSEAPRVCRADVVPCFVLFVCSCFSFAH